MRKCFYVLYALFIVGLLCPDMVAQNRRKSPMPDWAFKKPEPSNRTFRYYIEFGFGKTETEARNNAYADAFMMAARNIHTRLDINEIREAITSGITIEQLSQRFSVPMNVVCYYYAFRPKDIVCRILCQIPEEGYADKVQFDEFNDCDKQDYYKQFQKRIAALSEETILVTSENIEENKSATKILRDGQIIIQRSDKTYTITGAEVK